MSGLQESFYIIGIVFLSLMLLLIIVLLAAVLVIRAKINRIHDNIESKINLLTSVAERGGELSALAGSAVLKKAKKVIKKGKK
jgi:Na+-transporting methylmalonyl-CoA/oxaloacetate decarboxylase gamma subunit